MNMITVFRAKIATLEKAKKTLEAMGIACKITRPHRQEGILKVMATDAERAGELLRREHLGPITSAAEEAWFKCYVCGASLSEGQWHCSNCNAIVGDPHGR